MIVQDDDLRQKEAAYAILTTCQRLSPTGREQAAFAHMHNSMVLAGESWVEIIRQLANALADGVSSGNWPVWGFAGDPQRRS